MDQKYIDARQFIAFSEQLRAEERSEGTIEKYLRDVRRFFGWLKARTVDKNEVANWKAQLLSEVKYLTVEAARAGCAEISLKALCKVARIAADKVFPHNLRHLFAQEFYKICRDVVKLADILSHSNIETTRIYLLSAGEEHVKQLVRLNLIL